MRPDDDPDFPIALPGTTDESVGIAVAVPNGRWRKRLRSRLSALSECDPGFAPYLARAEERSDAVIAEITVTTGSCGPIAMTQVDLGAKFAELANYFLDHAVVGTKQGRQDILLARACADTSRLNLDGALRTAVSNARPTSLGDPLARFEAANPVVDVCDDSPRSGDVPDGSLVDGEPGSGS